MSRIGYVFIFDTHFCTCNHTFVCSILDEQSSAFPMMTVLAAIIIAVKDAPCWHLPFRKQHFPSQISRHESLDSNASCIMVSQFSSLSAWKKGDLWKSSSDSRILNLFNANCQVMAFSWSRDQISKSERENCLWDCSDQDHRRKYKCRADRSRSRWNCCVCRREGSTVVPSSHVISTNISQGREIKSHITPTGLLFATLSLAAPHFSEFFAGLEDLTNRVDFTKLPHRRSITYSGNFNWKTMSVTRILIQLLPNSSPGSMVFKNVFTVNTPIPPSQNFTHQLPTPFPIIVTTVNISPTPPSALSLMDYSCISSPSAHLMFMVGACPVLELARVRYRVLQEWSLIIIIPGRRRSLKRMSHLFLKCHFYNEWWSRIFCLWLLDLYWLVVLLGTSSSYVRSR